MALSCRQFAPNRNHEALALSMWRGLPSLTATVSATTAVVPPVTQSEGHGGILTASTRAAGAAPVEAKSRTMILAVSVAGKQGRPPSIDQCPCGQSSRSTATVASCPRMPIPLSRLWAWHTEFISLRSSVVSAVKLVLQSDGRPCGLFQYNKNWIDHHAGGEQSRHFRRCAETEIG